MEQVTSSRVGVKHGIVLSLVFIIYTLILELTGMISNAVLGFGYYLILILGILWACRQFKILNSGIMSFNQGFGLGMIVTVISGVVSSLFGFLYLKFIDDSSVKVQRDAIIHEYEKQGMSQSQIDQSMQLVDPYLDPAFTGMISVLGFLIVGLISTLFISAIMKKASSQDLVY